MANKFLEFTTKSGKISALNMRLIEYVVEYSDSENVSIVSKIVLRDGSIYLSQTSTRTLISHLNS